MGPAAGNIDILLRQRRANTGSATLSAYVGSWTEIYYQHNCPFRTANCWYLSCLSLFRRRCFVLAARRYVSAVSAVAGCLCPCHKSELDQNGQSYRAGFLTEKFQFSTCFTLCYMDSNYNVKRQWIAQYWRFHCQPKTTTVSAKLNWMAYSEFPWRPFLGHQARSWTTLRSGNVL